MQLKMPDNKLKEIGDKLDILEEDIRKIKNEKRKSRFLYPITGGIIAICSTLLGYLTGRCVEPRMEYASYPYGTLLPRQLTILYLAAPILGISSIVSALILRSDPRHKKGRMVGGAIVISSIIGLLFLFKVGLIIIILPALIIGSIISALILRSDPRHKKRRIVVGAIVISSIIGLLFVLLAGCFHIVPVLLGSNKAYIPDIHRFALFSIIILGIASVVFIKWDMKHKKSKRSTAVAIFMTVIASIVGFIVAYELFRPVNYYSEGILYNVFSKEKRNQDIMIKNAR